MGLTQEEIVKKATTFFKLGENVMGILLKRTCI